MLHNGRIDVVAPLLQKSTKLNASTAAALEREHEKLLGEAHGDRKVILKSGEQAWCAVVRVVC